jgi:hypothetical protein
MERFFNIGVVVGLGVIGGWYIWEPAARAAGEKLRAQLEEKERFKMLLEKNERPQIGDEKTHHVERKSS